MANDENTIDSGNPHLVNGKHTVEELIESEQKYRLLLQNCPDFVTIVDRDGIIQFINRVLPGLSIEKVPGQSIYKYQTPDSRVLHRKLLKQAFKTGQMKELEGTGTGPNDSIAWYQTRIVPIKDDGGQVTSAMLISTDITECKRMEEDLRRHRDHLEETVKERTAELVRANEQLQGEIVEREQIERTLRESEERYRRLVELSFDGVVIHRDGQVVFINATGAKTFGATSPEQLVGRQIIDFVHPDYRRIAGERMQEVQRQRRPVARIEEKFLRLDGTIIDVEVVGILITDQGQPAVQVVFQDITERKRMEKELLKMQKLESVGILAGGIAHDFNNILTGILGNISLARVYEDPEDKDRRLGEAEKASLRARDLALQLLTFSKGGMPIKNTVSIGDLLRDSANFVLSGSNVGCEFSIPDDLWMVEIDEGQMNQVINNIVINADQAMPDGGLINVYAENVALVPENALPLEDGKYVKVSIEDQGIGMPQEHLQRIFDPYFTTKQRGSGLGLATSYSIVRNHDGYITAESEAGVGTTFHIYLPASSGQTLTSEEEAEKSLIAGTGRILVMDDEEIVRELAVDILSRIGYEVVTAIDGKEAVALYEAARQSGNSFDAVIVDLTVPGGLGGTEVMQKLMDIDPEVRAIVSSGYSNDPIMASFREYGFKGLIAKPYKARELTQAVHKVITEADGL